MKAKIRQAAIISLQAMAHTAAGALASETLISRIDMRAVLSAVVLAGLSCFLSELAKAGE